MAKQTTTTTGGAGAGSTPRRPVTRSSGTAPAGGGSSAGRPSLFAFFLESRAELRKVTWPTRQETMNLTAAVIAMTVGMAVFLGLIDTGLDQLIKPLIGAK